MSDAQYTLYSYFRSSCSARLRIAMNAKGIPYELAFVNLLKNEHLSDTHKSLNPSASVPVLISHESKDKPFRIGQSAAALEYLEEKHPEHPLLPPTSNLEARATVRTLVSIICADIQPVTNLRIMRRVRELGGNAEDWNRQLMTDGLKAYEDVVKDSAGKCSVGDELTIADACLLPAMWNAERFGVDLTAFPTIGKIVESLKDHPAVVKAHWQNQPDTPDNLKA
ncbi:maleylacetoacetate isomerase [Fusarium austroafricanum]|uniref:Maleylacetoacetate isomerase n=1 Tax=Fusarium austroafricanum TaxID=2364996 RepID=A0A8H4NT54_9HYPO|nr:maleylacetoacetate isomerase [Fusarium austroafricanum]